jgi:hypothetical protein
MISVYLMCCIVIFEMEFETQACKLKEDCNVHMPWL